MVQGKFDPIPRSLAEPASIALAGVIREWRQKHGLSLNQLAERSQLSRQMLSFIESHSRLATTDTLERIGRALGVAGNHRSSRRLDATRQLQLNPALAGVPDTVSAFFTSTA